MAVIYCNADLASGSDDGTSEANAWQTVAEGITAINNAAAGSTLYIKRTSSRIDEGVLTITGNGDDQNCTTIVGYTSTITDAGMFEYGNAWTVTGDYVTVKNLDLLMSSSTQVFLAETTSEKCHLHNCKIYNTRTGSAYGALNIKAAAVVENCEIVSDQSSSSTSRGAIATNWGVGFVVSGCVIRGGNGIGALPYYTGFHIEGNIFCNAPNKDMHTGMYLDLMSGSNAATESSITNNTIITTKYGVRFVEIQAENRSNNCLVKNNLIHANGSNETTIVIRGNPITFPNTVAGIYNLGTTATTGISIVGNAIGNCGGTDRHIVGFSTTNSTIDNTDLTADPFVDKTNEDFRLNGTAGGGAACRASASPTTFKNMSYTNRRSIGAVGHAGLVERVSAG